MRALPVCLPLLAATLSHAAAATHEWKGYSETIPPGQAVERELGCTKGGLVAGGYALDGIDGPRSKVVPTANAPVSESEWRVGFYNDHDADVRVNFRISILCD